MKTPQKRGTGVARRQSPPDDPEQSKRFEEMARELGADESGKKFEAAFGALKSMNEKPHRRLGQRRGKRSKSRLRNRTPSVPGESASVGKPPPTSRNESEHRHERAQFCV